MQLILEPRIDLGSETGPYYETLGLPRSYPLPSPPPPPNKFPSSFPSPSTLGAPVLNVHQDSLLCRHPKQGGVKALDATAQPASEAGSTRVGQPVNIPAAKRHLRGGQRASSCDDACFAARGRHCGKLTSADKSSSCVRDSPPPPPRRRLTEDPPPPRPHLLDRVDAALGAGDSPARRPGGHPQYSNQLLAA